MRSNLLKISFRIREKLRLKHRVSPHEIYECFLNRQKNFLEDTRLDHQTEPPTFWFIAQTDHGRTLKIVFVAHEDGTYEVKTAYIPNFTEVRIYEKYA